RCRASDGMSPTAAWRMVNMDPADRSPASVTFKELHGALVLLRRRPRRERAQVAAAPGLRILLSGVETILARGEFADHAEPSSLLLRRANCRARCHALHGLPARYDVDAVHEHVLDPGRRQRRLAVRRSIEHARRIEDRDVGIRAGGDS